LTKPCGKVLSLVSSNTLLPFPLGTFIAKLAVKHISNPQLNREIKKMEKEFKAARPKGKGNNVLDETNDKTLPQGFLLF
jgi:hypothetical protein